VTTVRRVVAGSRVVRHARRLAAGSAVLRVLQAVYRPTQAPELRWTAEQEAQSVAHLRRVVDDSALVATLSRVLSAVDAAWQDAAFTGWVRRTWQVDVASRARVGGVALVTAVLTHVAWHVIFGIDVSVLGWSLRAALVAAGAAAAWWPEVLAAAVHDKAGRAD
jgi:hypothetical protein